MANQHHGAASGAKPDDPIGEVAAAIERERAEPAPEVPAKRPPVKPIGEVEAAIERGSGTAK